MFKPIAVALTRLLERLHLGRHPLPRWDPAWSRKEKGRWGERAAERYLWKEKGHRVLGRNLIVKGGEIDLLTDDRGELVFVEVKTRLEAERTPPLLAVDEEKMAHLRQAARRVLRRYRPPLPPARIDIIGVVPDPETGDPRIQHLVAVVRFPASPNDERQS